MLRAAILFTLLGCSLALRGTKRTVNPPSNVKVAYPEQRYDQRLDHFDMISPKRWGQRFWVNMDEYEEGGPALIMIGGEGEANPQWLNYGVWYSIAKENRAAMFLLEHRFYGQSWPTEDMSTENMKYLSSRQGLEDLATFMTAMSSTYNLTGPWVSFGGSYPGSMSAWLKLKYPHLLAGAVSSSGPLHAQLDFPEYLGVVRDALDTTGPGCNEVITEALEELEVLLLDVEQWPVLSGQFKTCNLLDGTNENDVKSFIELLIDNLAGIVQYNGFYDLDIFGVCDIMRDESLGSALERFAELNSQSLVVFGGECLDHEYSSFINLLTDINFNGGGVGWRPWIWQTCTEFGWYQTTNQADGVYGNRLDLDFFKSWCRMAFNDAWSDATFDQSMIDTNTEYGGFSPVVDNVVFVHGSIDPWHAMGVLEDLNDMAPSIYIEGTSHCADMYNDAPSDPEGLLDARTRIKSLVRGWIQDWPANNIV